MQQASILCPNPVRRLDNVGYYGRNFGAEETRKEVDGKTSEEDKFFSSGD